MTARLVALLIASVQGHASVAMNPIIKLTTLSGLLVRVANT